MMIIDPPITPASSEVDIRAWLSELGAMPQDDKNVIHETKWAQDCLSFALERSASAGARATDT